MPEKKQTLLPTYYERMPVDKLVSLTYDSNPKVRIKAALSLERVDDPRAVFALLELTADKEKEVNETARGILDRIKGKYSDALVSLEKVFAEAVAATEKEKEPDYDEIKQKLMPSIEKLFTRVDKRKAKAIRGKLMPSIEKLFSGKGKTEAEAEEKVEGKIEELVEEKAEAHVKEHHEEKPIPSIEEEAQAHDPLSEIEHMSHQADEEEDEGDEEGKDILEKDIEEKYETPQSFAFKDRQSIYEKAEQLASNPDVTDGMLKSEEKRITNELRKEVHLAFKIARRKARGNRIKGLSSVQEGMSNIFTPDVTVGSVESVSHKKGARKIYIFRLVLVDGTGKFPLYLSKIRGKGLSEGDTIRLEGAYVDPSPVAEEKGLFIASKGKVFVIK